MVVEYFLHNVWRSSFWDRIFSQPLYFNYQLLIILISLTNRSFQFLLLHPKEWLNHPRRGKSKKNVHNKCHLNMDNFRKWLHSQHLRKDRLQKQLRNHSRHPENVTSAIPATAAKTCTCINSSSAKYYSGSCESFNRCFQHLNADSIPVIANSFLFGGIIKGAQVSEPKSFTALKLYLWMFNCSA